LRDGAAIFTSVDDVLQELGYIAGLPVARLEDPGAGRAEPEGLSDDEAAVWECFRGGGIHVSDTVCGLTGRGPAEVSAALLALELKRLVRKRADGSFEAVPAQAWGGC
jgi:DNA processing protein